MSMFYADTQSILFYKDSPYKRFKGANLLVNMVVRVGDDTFYCI